MKRDENFFRVWGGIAGVQSTLAVLLDRQCPPERIAAMCAANPAQRFGIAGKGRIAVGNDADLALVDLDARYTVTADSLFQRHGLSPYLGAHFRGVVRRTILRGETIFADGKPVGQPRGRMARTTHAPSRIHA